MHQAKISGLLQEAAKLLKQDVDQYGDEVYDELVAELETSRDPHARLAAEMLYGIGDTIFKHGPKAVSGRHLFYKEKQGGFDPHSAYRLS